MTGGVNGVALAVFAFFFLALTVMGFRAARRSKPDNEHSLDESGLGGRSFGASITWFVLGGDAYTATADFVRGRFGSRGLSLAVAFTGILATMPCIASNSWASKPCWRTPWASAVTRTRTGWSRTCRC
ncbi:hypothetical protein M878_43700 [Streptomyces roseochromogenus subsp. oscitans DS 12.976]|uniref:Uncharacterized protein n=1 Tax=Streptomyces roseochromogenus subsp. oscitans DS 12.976 TaxID=1352936 RepID=V6JFZ9_STRRC|nr:hypothetical protein M878_43700 [Streptomyces roseochromogenus subsp. oscitans DS 12.976]